MEYINNINEFRKSFELAVSESGRGYVIAMLTDRFTILDLKANADSEAYDEAFYRELFQRAIEIRVFDERQENKWFRSSIGESLRYRKIVDPEGESDPFSYWDEYQYLDINEKMSKPGEGRAFTTGGGEYPLPLSNYRDAKVRIRNYLEYDQDTMRVSIVDWRLVEFAGGK